MQPDVDPQYRSMLEVSFGFEELRTPLEHSHTHAHTYTHTYTIEEMEPLYLPPLAKYDRITGCRNARLPFHLRHCILNFWRRKLCSLYHFSPSRSTHKFLLNIRNYED